MFHLSWRGYGLLGLLVPVLCCALTVLVLGDMDHPSFLKLIWPLMAACSIVLWQLGLRLNGDAEGDEAPHRFMGLTLQKVPLIYAGLFALWVVGKLA